MEPWHIGVVSGTASAARTPRRNVAAAIHAGARVVSDARGYAHAVLTTLIGALVWALLEPVSPIGGVLAPVA